MTPRQLTNQSTVDTSHAVSILWCLKHLLVAAPLPAEVRCLRVEAVAGAAGAQRRGATAVLAGSVVQQHILQQQQRVVAAAAA